MANTSHEDTTITMHLIEPLEARIAPASFFLYTDRDGDLVKVTSSKGDLNVDATITIALNQLRELDLTAPVFQGANISVSVKQAGNGDGLAHVGYIKANGRDLGTVIITGDLGQIDAGDSNEATAAVGALQVQSMGRVGTASQGGTGSLSSVLKGALGRLTIVGDLQDASISAVSVADPAFGKIGSVTIGGSILGGTISTSGNLGPVKIGRDLRAGDAAGGYLYSEGKMASVSIGGSLTGGTVAGSGSVLSLGDLGPVKVAGDVVGGSGPNAGFIFSNGKLAGVTIGGTLRGGSGDLTDQGQISSIGRVWADGRELDLAKYTWRLYTGSETQVADALI